jgi:tetratricopeptide (TPR) repeat protein
MVRIRTVCAHLVIVLGLSLSSTAAKCGSDYVAAYRWFCMNEMENSIHALNSEISSHPNCSDAYSLRSRCYMQKRKFSYALRDAQIAIRLSPNRWEYWSQSGCARKALNEYEGAISDLRHSLSLNPHHLETRVGLAELLIMLKRPSDVLVAVAVKGQLEDRDPRFFVYRGLALQMLKRRKQSIASLRQALQLYERSRVCPPECELAKKALGQQGAPYRGRIDSRSGSFMFAENLKMIK